jgi:type IV pilus assembly protein PilM
MPILTSLANLLKEPQPSHIFELSEAGIAYSRPAGKEFETGFAPFEQGTLVASPTEDNIRRTDVVAAQIARIAPVQDSRKRRPAALILPDYAARVSVLDFDSLPAKPDEQLALVRFRLKKTLPFDIDSAAVSYFVQPSPETSNPKNEVRKEVVAVSVALEIIARYEALFRAAAFHPGIVTTSGLAALNLYRGEGPTVIAKLEGRILTVMALVDGALKLFRCVEMEEATEDDVLAVLQPTFAYMEDELSATGSRLVLCGFPAGSLAGWKASETLSGHRGMPGPFNAGLLGYLEGASH